LNKGKPGAVLKPRLGIPGGLDGFEEQHYNTTKDVDVQLKSSK